jgi:hypothetical protein
MAYSLLTSVLTFLLDVFTLRHPEITKRISKSRRYAINCASSSDERNAGQRSHAGRNFAWQLE